MILIVLGTHELPFTRLLQEVEKCKLDNIITDDIIVQSGHTPYKSEVMTLQPFMSYEEMDKLYNQARLIITHGGTGSIISGLKKHKKVIAAARLKKYGEHNDDHQLELIEQFVNASYILDWPDGVPLRTIIKKAEDFQPRPFESGKENILTILRDYIENL